MRRTGYWLTLVLCVALIAGGALGAAFGAYQRSYEVRGWVDPVSGDPLPYRVPLAGVNVELTQYDADALAQELDAIAAAGFTWVRQTFPWAAIEPEPGRPDFSAYDAIVEAVAARPSLRLLAVLDTAPDWARRPEASDRLYAPPASMAAFGAFAGMVAARYADRIDYYQIWDEPNLHTHWGGLDPRPADYAAMLAAAYPAIKGSDATATVITAGLAPTVETGPRNLSDVLFLRALYQAGARDSFDAVAGKPYGFDYAPDDRTVRDDTLNFSRIILLREEMVRQGDGHKALWGSHFGWNHLPEGWRGPPSIWGQVDAETQARHTRAAYARAAREWPWMGGLILQHWQPDAPADDPIQGFAVRDRASDWFSGGAFFENEVLGVGLHHPTDPRLRYAGEWRFGALGADVQHSDPGDPPPDGSAHRLTFNFEGRSLAFQVRRAEYVAYLYIRVDGEPAIALPRIPPGEAVGGGESYIILKSPTLAPLTETIVAAQGLAPGTHTAEVRAYLGYARWLLAGIAVGDPPDTGALDGLIVGCVLLALIGLVGGGLLLRHLPPETLVATDTLSAYIHHMKGFLGALVLSTAAVLGLVLTVNHYLPVVLRRDLPAFALTVIAVGALTFSPALIASLAALIALWLIIYNRPFIGLALIVFWTPFFLLPVELFVWALPMVEIAVLLTATAVGVRMVVTERLRSGRPMRWRLADRAALLFALLALSSLLWADQISPATRELRIIIAMPFAFYFLLRNVRLARGDLVRLVDVLLLAGLAVSAYGLIQFVVGGPGVTVAEQGARRVMSVYSSPNNLALFLGRCIPFGVAMVLIAPGTTRRVIVAGIALVMGVALLLTQSIGALLLGIPAALAVVLLLWDRRRGTVIVVVMALAILALLPLSRFIPRLQGALDLTRSSSLVRTQLWTSTLNLLREHPLTGVGLDQFLYAYRSRYILPEAWQEPDLSHPHNLILDFWTRLGLGGVGILAMFQLAFWRSGWRAWRRLAPTPQTSAEDRARRRLLQAVIAGAMGSMAYFLAHGLVDNSYFVTDLAYVFWFSLALVTRLENPRTGEEGHG